MIAVGCHKGRTVKTVTVIEVESSDTDSRIVDVALEFAGETRSSIFNWGVTRYDGIADVRLDTD